MSVEACLAVAFLYILYGSGISASCASRVPLLLRQCEQYVHLQTDNTDVVKMSACDILICREVEPGAVQGTLSILIRGVFCIIKFLDFYII